MIQVKKFTTTGYIKIHYALDNLNKFLASIPEENVVRIEKLKSGGYMLVYKTKGDKND